jgi:basic amino acid/polyamine antiporter, APA family
MALTVASYVELSTRFPVSAGEAACVMAAFQSRRFATAIALVTVAPRVIFSATVTLGLPQYLIAMIVLALLGSVAAWGILESVLLASLFTVVEVGGLVVIIVAAIHADLPFAAAITQCRRSTQTHYPG